MKKTRVIERKGKTLKEKIYLPAIFGGLKTTLRHFRENINNSTNLKVEEYPECGTPIDVTDKYRARHRLTRHSDDDSIKCVACFMCATNCPAECITIEATAREDIGKAEKMPKRFDIDLLECVFCGYCVEACPHDAIRMDTGIFSVIGKDREDFIITKDELLSSGGIVC
jgi:NADH-quinone oxidoreductase subunit I